MPKKSTKSAAKRTPRTKKSSEYPKTSCGQFWLVPNGDGTAREVPVSNVNG